jgi:hypothetical protein
VLPLQALLVQLVLGCHMWHAHDILLCRPCFLPLQALLPSHTGALAECVSQLLVQLVLACHMLPHSVGHVCCAALAGVAA